MHRLLLLGLVVVLAGCGAHAPLLTIVETTGFGRTLQQRTFHLDCDPPHGLALAAEACAAIQAHPQAMLHPPPARSFCAGSPGMPTLLVRGRGVRIEGAPACAWPGGSALLLYEAAIHGDRDVARTAASRLRCDEDPQLLAHPTPFRSVFACTHGLWTRRSERLIAAAKRALGDGRLFPRDVGVLPCAGVARCGVSVHAATVRFVEAWERARHTWSVHVDAGSAAVVASTGPAPPRDLAWVAAANRHAVARLTAGANLSRIHYLLYPRKVAVVVEFDRPAAMLFVHPPRGGVVRARALRFSYDRTTRLVNDELRLCEPPGNGPPLSACLAR